MSEEWRPVVGFEGLYEVSDQGRVRSLDREVRSGPGRTRKARSHILKPSAGQDGYLRVNLWQDNQYRSRTVHSLVAESFFGFVSGKEVRHLDGNKGNCSKTNLVWDSRRQNTLDRKWVDRHKKLTTAQAAEIKRRLSEGEYGRALAREFNVSKTSIYFIKIGKHHADVMLNGARAWK